MGTYLRVLSESYPMNTNMTGCRWFSKIFALLLWMKVASALEGFNVKCLSFSSPQWYSKELLGHSNLITCLTSFLENPVRLQKKRKKSHLWCLTDESGFENFLSDSKNRNEKSASFKNILCRCDSINYRKLSLL